MRKERYMFIEEVFLFREVSKEDFPLLFCSSFFCVEAEKRRKGKLIRNCPVARADYVPP